VSRLWLIRRIVVASVWKRESSFQRVCFFGVCWDAQTQSSAGFESDQDVLCRVCGTRSELVFGGTVLSVLSRSDMFQSLSPSPSR
jgi:hypothetical protein